MKSRVIKFTFIVLFVSISGYLLSLLFGNQESSNFISPFVSLSTLLLIMLTMERRGFFYLSWMLLALIAAFWGIADVIWMMLYNFWDIDPESSILLLYLYLVPNVLLCFSGLLYFKKNLKKWHNLQLIVDAIVAFLLTLIILQFSYFQIYDFTSFSIHENVTNIAYLLTDAFAMIIAVVLLQSARITIISRTMKWIIGGYLLFIITDFTYLFFHVLRLYEANSLIDGFYLLSLSFFGFGAYSEWKSPSLVINPNSIDVPQNTGASYRLLYFLVFPIILLLKGILVWYALLPIIMFLFLYYFLSYHIQASIKKESYLLAERSINEQLENIINSRTAALKASNAKLEKLATRDMLSDLYNRYYFMEKIDQLIADGVSRFSIYYLDLDHFKVINDIHGHEMGDRVLKAVSLRFERWQNEQMIFARVGGDEFAIINVHDLGDETDLSTCQAISDIFTEEIKIDNYAFIVGCSIGISRYPIDATDRDNLMKHSDLAMYQAKQKQSFEKIEFYSHQHGELINRRNKIEMLLKMIDYDSEFELHYQPQLSIDGEVLLGAEALIRWHSPELGYVSPIEFIRIAEETGFIIKIGKWVVDNAFLTLKKWSNTSTQPLKISINLSPMQFDSIDFLPYLMEKIVALDIDPKLIDFEITESSAMNSGFIMEEIFTKLSEVGIQISLDDFGTGYSSLSYIKRFDIDRIKIAKELIDHIAIDHNARLIVNAIILMAKGLDLSVIAEGVEHFEQLEILKEMGCDAIQGYYYSKPLTQRAFEEKYI